MKYRYVKAPPGYTLRQPITILSKIRFGLSILLFTLGIATFTTVAYPLITYQITFAPRFQKSALVSPLSPTVVATQDLMTHPVKQVKAEDQAPRFASEIVNTALDYTDASSWFGGSTTPQVSTNKAFISYTLSIAKLGIDHAVVRNDHTDLKQSLIQYAGTALPGDLGNTVIFGHSVLPQFFNPKNYLTIFSTLHTLRPGDTIEVAADGATYTYKIAEMYEAAPDDLSPLAQVYDGRYLTLITCTPPGTYLRRLIIRAYML